MPKKIVRITESDFNKIVERVLSEQGLLGKVRRFFPSAKKEVSNLMHSAAPFVAKETRLSTYLSDIVKRLPKTVKMPQTTFGPLKNRVLSIEGTINRLSKEGSGIKATHLGLFSSIERVSKELKIPAGSQFDLTKVINDLSSAKWEIEEILKTTNIKSKMSSSDISLMETTLRDINWSLGNIEEILKKYIK